MLRRSRSTRLPGRECSVLSDMYQHQQRKVPRRERSSPVARPPASPIRVLSTPVPPISILTHREPPKNSPSPATPISSAAGVFLYVQVRVHGVVQKLLVPRMLAQVPVADRVFLLRKYRRCFTGTDAVAWFMARRFARDVPEAVALGNAMLRAGVFRHVRNEHTFRNGHYFYRFAAHEEYAVDDDNYAGLRSSRLMSVAMRPYAARVCRFTSSSDESTFCSSLGLDEDGSSSSSSDARPSQRPYDERHVAVDVGIRVGARLFPDLVSKFTTQGRIAGVNIRNGKKIRDSFSGSLAAYWLKQRSYARDDREAVAVGNALIKAGVFFPIDDSVTGFEISDDALYRLTIDVDLTADLRRGEMKDTILRLFGINRARNADPEANNAPWFDDSLSFTTSSDTGP